MATVDEASHADPGVEDTMPAQTEITNEESAKRKASFDDEGDSAKRPRPSEDSHRAAGAAEHGRDAKGEPPASADERRKSAVQEEKKRGKRLFGGLLSTLSQTKPNPQHQRRQEIERRQQERLQQQRAEDDQRRAEEDQRKADQFARVRDIRRIHLGTWEDEVMHNRHTKMLDQARYLRTKSMPQIYYLPWKPTEEQRDIIDDQIREAKRLIDRDLARFGDRGHGRRDSEVSRRRSSVASAAAANPERVAESGPTKDILEQEEAPKPEEAAADKPPETASGHHGHHHHHHDETGEMVDAGEDMVIY